MPRKYLIGQHMIEKEFNEIFQYALSRFRYGAEEHGDFNPELDNRDDFKEILDELTDSIVYISMFIMKLRRIDTKLDKMGYKKIIKKRSLVADKHKKKDSP